MDALIPRADPDGSRMSVTVTPTFTILLSIVRPPVFLPYAIKSVLEQTVEKFELFVICDGAPPETVECAQEHARSDPRIKVLVFPKGERIGEAYWHETLMGASGRYVAHIEDDDLWFPSHLEELENLLNTVDFGNLMHVWAMPDESIEMLPSDLARPEFQQRMLDEKFNGFGFSVCGYRLDAYRRLPEGWAPAPEGFWPDLHMWRKFLRRDDFKFGTRMAVTALVLASTVRPRVSLDDRGRECRKWLDRIFDERERTKIIEAAWRSIVNQQLQTEYKLREKTEAHAEVQARILGVERELIEKTKAHAEMQEEFERVMNSNSWRITKPLRKAMMAVRRRMGST
jgi:glycosyltransferase involved in cell wall biosynthesis